MARVVIENYRAWAIKGKINEAQVESRSSTLFDTVAIYLAMMKRDFVVMEKLGIRVTNSGYTAIDGKAKKIDCATDWKNVGAYEDFLVERACSVSTADAASGNWPARAGRNRRISSKSFRPRRAEHKIFKADPPKKTVIIFKKNRT
jgi:hypothetical protein